MRVYYLLAYVCSDNGESVITLEVGLCWISIGEDGPWRCSGFGIGRMKVGDLLEVFDNNAEDNT